MNPAAVLGAAVVLAAATSFATVQMLPPATPPAGPANTDDAAGLRREVDALRQQLAAMRAAPAAATVPASSTRLEMPQLTDEQIESALQRYLAAHGGKLAAAAVAGGDGAIDLEAAIAKLRGGDSDFWSNSDLFKKLHAAGRMDELIKSFEELAKQNPKDPQAHMDLGNAYLAYLQMDNSKWELSMKADASFDQVLAIDENHWEARFTKAVSYTFWPDFLGKKKEAIAHFEHLVQQQETMPADPDLAQTYLFLGNILEQRGETDRAREVWQRGLRRHPDDAALKQKLGL